MTHRASGCRRIAWASAAPFKMALPLTTQPDYYVYEYACHEGNYGLTNILSGARAEE